MDEHRKDRNLRSFSRRQFLHLLGGAGAISLLGACGTSSPAAAPTTQASAAAATAAPATASGPIRIPSTGAQLPTEQVTLRWIDSGGPKSFFTKQYLAAYQQAHPNITIQYDALSFSEIGKVVPLGIQSGNAHDIFQLPLNVTPGQAVREGWITALDDVIPNFAAWKAAFPNGSFLQGINEFDGKIYSFPWISERRYDTLTVFNPELMQRAGYDLATKPLTWDEFRSAAKKVTEQGKGQYYGLIIGAKDPNYFTRFQRLAQLAGASGGDINWKTGQYQYTSDGFLAAIDLLLALKSDGSIFPGSTGLDQTSAGTTFATGVAGMYLDGPWRIWITLQESTDFIFDVTGAPQPTADTTATITYLPLPTQQLYVYADSPQKIVAGDALSYIGTEEGQAAVSALTNGTLQMAFPTANQQASDPRSQRANELFERDMRRGPILTVRNPDAEKANLELKAAKPSLGEIIQGIYSGQLTDPRAALQDLQDRSEAELERAIKAAQAKGAQVSRDDWAFPNWDPSRDYAMEDYAAL